MNFIELGEFHLIIIRNRILFVIAYIVLLSSAVALPVSEEISNGFQRHREEHIQEK